MNKYVELKEWGLIILNLVNVVQFERRYKNGNYNYNYYMGGYNTT